MVTTTVVSEAGEIWPGSQGAGRLLERVEVLAGSPQRDVGA
jgi:hypothetical protein